MPTIAMVSILRSHIYICAAICLMLSSSVIEESKAAEQVSARDQYNLGVGYGKGEGVPQDYIKAAYWYRKSVLIGIAKMFL